LTTTCDDVRTARALGARLGDDGEAHVAACASCRHEMPALATVDAALGRYAVDAPPSGLRPRVLDAAASLLVLNARRARRRHLVRAVAAGLVPLPLIVLVDFVLVRTLGELLGTFLPRALTVYFVAEYAALLALLVALTYAAIPLLAARQLAFASRRFDGR
jgi:hypothetical protein